MKLSPTFSFPKLLLWIGLLCGTFAGGAQAEAQEAARGLKVVVIDAGHGGPNFPGAVYGGVKEKEINLAVALELGRLVEEGMKGVKVVYTRTTDKQFSSDLKTDLKRRSDLANEAGGDLFISIHANAARSPKVRGVETLIMGESSMETRFNSDVLYANNKDEFVDMSDSREAAIVRAYLQTLQFTYGQYSEAMARILQNNYAKSGRTVRSIKRQVIRVLYGTDMPSILTEVGFMTHPQELAYMNSKKGQQEIARTIYQSVRDYDAFVRGSLQIGDVPETRLDEPETAEPDTDAAGSAGESAPSGSAESPAAAVERGQTESAAGAQREPKGSAAAGAPESARPAPPAKEGQPAKADPPAKNGATAQSGQSNAEEGYTIQILSSNRRIGVNSPSLKIYRGKARELVGTGKLPYKYCVGKYATRAEAAKALPGVRKRYSDAFVVRYRGDKIVK